ncbi:MAG: SPASM domain-containing protein [Candidatus Omnitrophica bacterium]|nr:SPASM domain-containing protein [Candidatus Omnitrophota bacterium]
MKINKDYFRLSSKNAEIRYFLFQRHIFAHLIDRLKWHLCPKLYITPNFPSHIDIEVSSKCQLQCPMCGQRRMDSEMKGDMDFALYKKIIDECTTRHVYSVKLSWRGEPLLNPDLFEMIKYAKEKGIKDVMFLTNVERFDDDKIQELIESEVDWISCSVDGRYEIYERIRYPAKFEDTVGKIKKIVEMRRKLNKRKPLVRIQTIFSAIKSNPAEYKNFWEPIVDKINFIADQVRQKDEKNFPRDPDYVCQSPWQRMCIDFKGRVPQCHADYLEKNILGNVRKQSLYEIWHGEPFKRVRALQKSKQALELAPCRECSDRGKMKEVVIDIGYKKQKILKYVDQELDLETMDTGFGNGKLKQEK